MFFPWTKFCSPLHKTFFCDLQIFFRGINLLPSLWLVGWSRLTGLCWRENGKFYFDSKNTYVNEYRNKNRTNKNLTRYVDCRLSRSCSSLVAAAGSLWHGTTFGDTVVLGVLLFCLIWVPVLVWPAFLPLIVISSADVLVVVALRI